MVTALSAGPNDSDWVRERTASELLEWLKEWWPIDDPAARSRFAVLLRDHGSPEMFGFLSERMAHEEDEEALSAAAYALQAPLALPFVWVLIRTVQDEAMSPRVRGMALESLMLQHGDLGRRHARRLIYHESAELRFDCCLVLGMHGAGHDFVNLWHLYLTDHRSVKSFGTVSREALGAIQGILQRRRSNKVLGQRLVLKRDGTPQLVGLPR